MEWSLSLSKCKSITINCSQNEKVCKWNMSLELELWEQVASGIRSLTDAEHLTREVNNLTFF